MFRFILHKLIRVYQLTLSPDHGVFRARFPNGFCRFYPSCSEYTRLSILRFGGFKGVGLGLLRILKCNPFSIPAVDLPILNSKTQTTNHK